MNGLRQVDRGLGSWKMVRAHRKEPVGGKQAVNCCLGMIEGLAHQEGAWVRRMGQGVWLCIGWAGGACITHRGTHAVLGMGWIASREGVAPLGGAWRIWWGHSASMEVQGTRGWSSWGQDVRWGRRAHTGGRDGMELGQGHIPEGVLRDRACCKCGACHRGWPSVWWDWSGVGCGPSCGAPLRYVGWVRGAWGVSNGAG